MDDVRYVGEIEWRRKTFKHPRGARVCRATSLLDIDHLSLGEIDRLITETSHRQKLRRHGVAFTAADNEHWAALNRVPRRPPIYEDDRPAPKGAA